MSKVNLIVDDLRVQLQSIAAFENKTVHVLNEEEFFKTIQGLPPPTLGVIYEGLRPKTAAEGQKSSHRVGLSADMGIALMLVMQSKSVVGGDLRGTAIEHLDTIREKLKDTRSASGHYWQFVMEAPAIEKGGYTLWVQRWSTPVQLT